MEKKEKNLNLVKDNSKFLITIGTCVILLMVMLYVGTNTSKQTFSASTYDCSSFDKEEYNGQCCKIEYNISPGNYLQNNPTIAESTCKQVSSHINCQVIGPYECSGHIDATTAECEHSEWDGKYSYTYDNVTDCEAIPTKLTPTISCSGGSRLGVGRILSCSAKYNNTDVLGITTFISDDTNIIGNNGKALKEGGPVTVTVKFTPADTNTYNTSSVYKEITVIKNDTSCSFTSSSNVSIKKGETSSITGLKATTKVGDTDNIISGNFTYSSRDTSIATVNTSGVITGEAYGVTDVVVTFTPNDTDTYNTSTCSVGVTVTDDSDNACTVAFTDSSAVNLSPGESTKLTVNVSGLASDDAVAGYAWTGDTSIITGGTGSGQSTDKTASSTISVGNSIGSSTTLTVKVNTKNGGTCQVTKKVNIVDKDSSKFGKLTFYNNYGSIYKIKYCEFGTGDSCKLDLLAFTCPPGYKFSGWSSSRGVCTGSSLSSSGIVITLTKSAPTASRYACCEVCSTCSGSGSGSGSPSTTPGPGPYSSTTPGPYSSDSPIDNPQTGNTLIIIVWLIGILMIGYSVWYFKNGIKNSD